MNGWIPTNPDSWARALGLVRVPLFGSGRPNVPGGVHSLMLDGDAGSFTLSVADAGQLLSSKLPAQWAWSSNVRHSVVVDAASSTVSSFRWDAPDQVNVQAVPSTGEAKSFLHSLEDDSAPEYGRSVITRALRTFREVRDAIESRGGSPVDSVVAFNALLVWLAELQSPAAMNLGELVALLHSEGKLLHSTSKLAQKILSYPITDLAAFLKDESYGRQYIVDADLLIRHASGTLYQEAHRILLREPVGARQQNLFFGDILGEAPKSSTPPASDIHHTPASLARAMAEVAFRQLDLDSGPKDIRVLDAACGSGVFLIEAIRDSANHNLNSLSLKGIDKSRVATAMSEFCLRQAVADGLVSESISADVSTTDSLVLKKWPTSDIVLMNPPFRAWESLSGDERKEVHKTITGNAAATTKGIHRPDISFAFVQKALDCLSPGGVLATLVPASFLHGKAAQNIRQRIEGSGEFQLRMVGVFRGYKYFGGATVEPAVIVVSKSSRKALVRVLIAQQGCEERAIRALRSEPWSESIETAGFELYNLRADQLAASGWLPKPQKLSRLIAKVERATPTRVGDLFTVRLGVRVGNKRALMVPHEEFLNDYSQLPEAKYFRPIADQITNGRIIPSGFLFYPYSESGQLLIKTEDQLTRSAPYLYQTRLAPARAQLEGRGSRRSRKWWEPSEPVLTWLAAHKPRIISQEFARSGKFAYDPDGIYAVVQGHGWVWNEVTPPSAEVFLAYLAVVNCSVFDTLLACYCTPLQGGQFVVRRQYMERVPLPSLTDMTLTSALASIGTQIHSGQEVSRAIQRELVLKAYGLEDTDLESGSAEAVQQEFIKLADEWRKATAILSFSDQKTRHASYRRIIDLGEAVVPLLLLEMRERPSYWDTALKKITGADPVPDDADGVKGVASAWLQWGRANGYDV